MIRLSVLGPIVVMMLSVLGYSGEELTHLNTPRAYQSQAYEETTLHGMVIPHHLVAIDKIESMYKTASSDRVKQVLLISPDHFLNDKRQMTSSNKNWYVDGGKVLVDQTLLQELLNDGIELNDKEIEIEHGLNTHVPFIKMYFPNASIVPIAISKQTNIDYLNDLIQSIPEDVFLIASVDFSHYLDLQTANEKDEWTKMAIKSGDYESFFKKSDDYFDSPGCLYVFSCFARKSDYDMVFYDHSNSAYYMGKDIPETTSYFFIGLK